MANIRQYIEKSSYRVSKIFREKKGSFVALMQRQDSSQFICRTYDHPVPGYRATEELAIPQLPATYCCKTEQGLCIVEEEYVDGISLTELMEVYHPDVSQTAAICVQVCRALEALHAKGIIHRDVKPDNVLLTSEGRVVLIDLDAASQYDPEKERDTTLLGTVGYAAPEQFGFSRSDIRTDIFSLGVMLNVMLTGEHPAHRLADGAIRPIIERCIEVNADKRFSSAADLGKKLTELAGEAERCPQCGTVSPGGGCLCCGTSSKGAAKKANRIPLITAMICAALIVGLLVFGPKEKEVAEIPDPSATESAATAPITTVTPDPHPTKSNPEVSDATPESPQMQVYQGQFDFDKYLSDSFTVTVNGTEHIVYLCAGGCDQEIPSRSGGMSLALGEDDYTEWNGGIGFYRQSAENEYARINDAEVLTAIQKELGDSLRMEVLAYNWEAGLPEVFPDQITHQCSNGCYEGKTLRLGWENSGFYILRATGTANGKELVSEVRLEWKPTQEIKFDFDPNGEALITQVNTFLSDLEYRDGISVSIPIPAGTHEGTLVVPSQLGQAIVNFNGVGSASVIKGGIENQNHLIRVFNLTFEGAGAAQAAWPDGRANVALSGDGGAIFGNCEFRDYNVALVSKDRLKSGSGSRFLNNYTAVLIDTLSANGNGELSNNEYRNNEIAIHFKTLNEDWPIAFFNLSESRFIDNKIDLHNEIGREIPLPNGYFADTANGAEVQRECRTSE